MPGLRRSLRSRRSLLLAVRERAGRGRRRRQRVSTRTNPGAARSRGTRYLSVLNLSPGRMRLLALFSALATGLVIWAGLSREDSSGLAAVVAQRAKLLASAAGAASAARQSEATSAQGTSGEAASEAAAAPAGE